MRLFALFAGVLLVCADSALSQSVVHFNFAEGSGDFVYGVDQNGFVSSTGVLAPVGGGDFTGGVGGKFGGALTFDPPTTKAWSGHTNFAQFSPDFDLANQGSVSFFVKHDALGFRQAYFNTTPDPAGDYARAELHQSNRVFSEINGPANFTASGTVLSTNWHHIVSTWDATANQNRIYVDGVLQNTSATSGYTNMLGEAIRFGRRFDEGSPSNASIVRPLVGSIDDIAYYGHVLSGAEINSIGASGAAAAGVSGLVTHWNLDNAVGTTSAAPDGGTSNAPLSIGTPAGTGVTFQPGALTTPNGTVLSALEFDGASELSRVIISDSPALDFDKTRGTIAMWVRVDDINQRNPILKTTDESLEIQADAFGNLYASANDDNNTPGNVASGNRVSSHTFVEGEWTHIAFYWDQTLGVQNFYVDGVAVGGTGGNATWTVPNTADWVLGNDPIVPNRHFDGAIASLFFFDRVLSAQEIQQYMLIPEPTTFALWIAAGLALPLAAQIARKNRRRR